MDNESAGIDLEVVNRLVTNAMTSVAFLTENISSFWVGPAAAAYRDAMTQSIDFTRLIDLLRALDYEANIATELLTLE